MPFCLLPYVHMETYQLYIIINYFIISYHYYSEYNIKMSTWDEK